jgi:hypothetical protein
MVTRLFLCASMVFTWKHYGSNGSAITSWTENHQPRRTRRFTEGSRRKTSLTNKLTLRLLKGGWNWKAGF